MLESRGRAALHFGLGVCLWDVERTSIQLSHSIGRIPIVTLLFVIVVAQEPKGGAGRGLLITAWFVRAIRT